MAPDERVNEALGLADSEGDFVPEQLEEGIRDGDDVFVATWLGVSVIVSVCSCDAVDVGVLLCSPLGVTETLLLWERLDVCVKLAVGLPDLVAACEVVNDRLAPEVKIWLGVSP